LKSNNNEQKHKIHDINDNFTPFLLMNWERGIEGVIVGRQAAILNRSKGEGSGVCCS
jgi:hypothetical protein